MVTSFAHRRARHERGVGHASTSGAFEVRSRRSSDSLAKLAADTSSSTLPPGRGVGFPAAA